MSKNIAGIPYTELVERATQIARVVSENDRSRARGAVNDMYCRVLPAREDWAFLLSSSAITCDAQYTTGTATVNTQGTVVTFSSDATLPSMTMLWKIKFTGNANVYEFTRSNNTGGTISPPLSGTTNLSGAAYTLFHDTYPLAPDFDRFPKNGGVLLYQGGNRTVLKEMPLQSFLKDVVPNPGTPQECYLVQFGTAGVPHVQLDPPPRDPFVFPYWYTRVLDPLRETTAGFVDINSGATAVVGSAGTTRFTELSTGAFFRISAFGTGEDSEWYRLSAIATNSSSTLGVAFGLSGATTATYVMCDVPKMPPKMHLAILYGAVKMLLSDENDPTYQYYDRLERELMTEARKQYKTRIYDQEIDTIATEWQYRR